MTDELMKRVEEINKEMNELLFQYNEDKTNTDVICRFNELYFAVSEALEVLSKI